MAVINILEDDEVIRGQLSQLLRDKGYEVIESADISSFNNFDNLTIKKAGKDIQLSPTEFALLEILVCNRCLIVRREVFFQKLWDRTGTFVEDNTLTVTVSRLKTKLGKMDNSDKNYIDTIRGVGYRWRER